MRHLDVELLQAVLAGELPVKLLMRQVLAHVTELCPECEEMVASLREAIAQAAGGDAAEGEALPAGSAGPTATGRRPLAGQPAEPRHVAACDGDFDRSHRTAREWASQVRRERRRARADVRELLSVPPAARARRIERAHTRYRSRAVAELLLEESRRLVRAQPAEARSLAGLVDLVLLWTPGAVGQAWARDLGVLAQAWVANTYRVEFELRAAERKFAELRARMSRELVGEAVHAEVASLEASLRFDQGRSEEARRLLDQAALLHRADRDDERLARVLIKRALLEDRLGDPTAAAAAQREALELLAPAGPPRLLRESIANLALFLVNGGEVEEAAGVLREHQAALQEAGMWDEPRLQIIRGRLALASPDAAEAERLFLAARAELVRCQDVVRAAVASLDLAALYLAQGRTAELRRMARRMGSILDSAELESEALSAVILFQKAVEAQSLTEAAIRAWRRQLEVSRGRGGRSTPAS